MADRVLVPVDDSEMAEQALTSALELYPDAEITVLHVVGEPSAMMGKAVALALSDDMEATAREQAEEIFESLREVARTHDAEIDTEVGYGSPAKVILRHAGDYDAVVIGSHGGSLADRLIVGNVAETVFRRSPVPVTVVR